MKKFLFNIFVFLCIAAVCDIAVGYAMRQLGRRVRSGQALKNHEILETASPDILILGSSRSTHHLVPQVLEDSLGMTAYVAGQDGNGIIMMDPLLHYIAGRHKPKTVIYDLISSFDYDEDDPHQYLQHLRLLWGNEKYVDSVICEIDPTERYKLMSQMFRYNSWPLSYVKGCLTTTNEVDRGYTALSGVLQTDILRIKKPAPAKPASSLKMKLLREMIDYCGTNHIQLYFTVSPYYHVQPVNDAALVDSIKKFGGTVLDFTKEPGFDNPAYFSDEFHLNQTGATKFTQALTERLRGGDTERQLRECGR